MTAEKLFDCFGDIDEHYIKEAAPGNRPAKKPWRALAGAAAAVVVLAAAVMAGIPALWNGAADQPPPLQPDPALSNDVIEDAPGCGDAPGYIRWHGRNYFNHGHAVYEMPVGVELLGEVDQVVEDGGLIPEDAGDLSANIDGYAYWFPGNDSLIVFQYKDWDSSYAAVELGRKEPILLMFRELDEEEPHRPGQPYHTLPDMMADSDVIVEGTVLERGGADPAGGGEAVYTLRITHAFRRIGGMETVQVKVPADSGAFEMSRDDTYLLFLRGEADGTFRPVSTSQGVYAIEGKFLHIPANDPLRIHEMPTLHTEDNDFWEGVNDVRDEIQKLQGVEPVT